MPIKKEVKIKLASLLLLAAVLLVAGCGEKPEKLDFYFDFPEDAQGREGDFTDYPPITIQRFMNWLFPTSLCRKNLK